MLLIEKKELESMHIRSKHCPNSTHSFFFTARQGRKNRYTRFHACNSDFVQGMVPFYWQDEWVLYISQPLRDSTLLANCHPSCQRLANTRVLPAKEGSILLRTMLRLRASKWTNGWTAFFREKPFRKLDKIRKDRKLERLGNWPDRQVTPNLNREGR